MFIPSPACILKEERHAAKFGNHVHEQIFDEVYLVYSSASEKIFIRSPFHNFGELMSTKNIV